MMNFDLSDVEPTADTLDDVLRVAAEVVAENAPDPGRTRLERLARWVAEHLGGHPSVAVAGSVTRFTIGDVYTKTQFVDIWRVGTRLCISTGGKDVVSLTREQALEIVVALLRAVDSTEA